MIKEDDKKKSWRSFEPYDKDTRWIKHLMKLPRTEIERMLDQHEERYAKLLNYNKIINSNTPMTKDQRDELEKLTNDKRVALVKLDLRGYVFSMRDLSGLRFEKCDLTNAKFDKCTFSENTLIFDCILNNTMFENCKGLKDVSATADNKFYIERILKAKTAKPTDPVCKDWGTVNGWDKKTEEEFEKAKKKHEQMMKANPSAHDYHEQRIGRGYSEYKCKCGFRWGVDYSD